jgi:predicted DNA-binding transcriptional regulator YafY
VHYFQNRQWHQSQRQTIDPETGDMIMELYVPLGPDFISWILSWHDAIKVIKPVELIDKVKARLRATLYSYTK